MLETAKYVTAASSLALRAAAFVFLRWIPGHPFPPIVWTLFAIYVPTFLYVSSFTTPADIVGDNIKIETRATVPADAKDVDPRYASRDAAEVPGEELIVEEELELEPKDPEAFVTLVTGMPSPSSPPYSILTFLINLAIVAMVTDLVYRAPLLHASQDLSMARVGYVSDTTAKILIRETNASQFPVFISYRHADEPAVVGRPLDTAWKSGGSIDRLDPRTDFTGSFELAGLKADHKYQYTISNNHSGVFTTAPHVGEISTRATNGNMFTFLHSSCVKLNFPYSPFNHPLSAKGFQYLDQSLRGLGAQFMIFLGDFIYADVPKRHGKTIEDYRLQYRQVYASPDWRAVAEQLPMIHVYDDHELANDWSGNVTGLYNAAVDPYEHYHTSVNPPAVRKGESYFSFTQGPAAFFMLDTRRYRSPNDKTNGSDPVTGEATKTMLGAQQLADLLAWLKRPEPRGVRWKIVVSSVPFTKNWWFGAQDTWRGYLGERQLILEAMWDVGLKGGVGVVILSGDRHEFAATAFPPPPEGQTSPALLRSGSNTILPGKRKKWPLSATVHEFSASPMNMFYLPIRTYSESSTSDDYISDVCIRYLPDGNHKHGAVSISNPTTSDQSILHYRLYVDGVEAWSYTLTTPPSVGGSERSKDAIWG